MGGGYVLLLVFSPGLARFIRVGIQRLFSDIVAAVGTRWQGVERGDMAQRFHSTMAAQIRKHLKSQPAWTNPTV